MMLRTGLLAFALLLLPGCDAVEQVIDTFSQPTAEELTALTELYECEVVAVSASGMRDGSLAGGDCQIQDGSIDSLADVYAFRVTSETGMRLQMRAGDFSPFLILATADGERLQSAGASEGSDTVGITYRLNAGTYVIVANSVENNQTGTYTLDIERE